MAPDAIETIGNNVCAYADLRPPDGLSPGDYTSEITSTATFDYPLDIAKPDNLLNNRRAAITNLFYLNNYLHHEFYDHGFDETSGNAQMNNYGRCSEKRDDVRAEVHDYGTGVNNANMLTPADGAAPRLQMYLWSQASQDTFVLLRISFVDRPISAVRLLAPPLTFMVGGEVVRVNDGVDIGGDGCEPNTKS